MARMITLFGSVPCTINPPIITLSPVCTKARVEMLPSRAIGVGVAVGAGVAVGVTLGMGEGVAVGVSVCVGGKPGAKARAKNWKFFPREGRVGRFVSPPATVAASWL